MADLQSFLDNGHGESHFLEFKQQLPPKNKDIAKKLAGFAINGGALVIGVAEPKPGKFEVRPIQHAGLREKVEQIAQSLVDPGLRVESRVLKDPADDSCGVLWITVPVSPEAPHQVDGRHYARGDTQTRPMSAAAVKRVIRESPTLSPRRHIELEDIKSKLREVMENDPIPNGKTARVFGIAEPVGAGPEDLYEAIGGDDGWLGFCEEARRIREEYPPAPGKSSPGAGRPWYELIQPYSSWDSGPDGYTVHCGDADAGDDGYVLRISFGEDGSIRYVNNVGSRRIDNVGSIPPNEYFLHAGWIVASCLDVLDAARAVARRTGQRRSWDIGFGLTGTKGLRAYGDPSRYFHPSQPFPDPGYKDTVRVTHQQLETDVWGVACKLTRRFLRGCGLTFEQVARDLGYREPEDVT